MKHFFIFFFIAWFCQTKAQDVHWSQQAFGSLQQSPAMAGSYKGTLRSTLQYRNQWRTVPVGFESISAAVEREMGSIKGLKSLAALRILSDKAGDAGLSWTQAEAFGRLEKPLSKSWALSLGLGISAAQRRFDLSKLSFQKQWNGDIYDENTPNGESFRQSSGLILGLHLGLGLHFSRPNEDRTTLHIYTGGFNLNAPQVSFENVPASQLGRRFTLGGRAVLQVSEKIDVLMGSFFQKQSNYTEELLHGGARLHFSPNGDNATFVELGAGFRFGDALIPSLRFDWNAWSLGVSYDLNLSDFQVATQGRGGFELGLMHRIVPVAALKSKKVCPIF